MLCSAQQQQKTFQDDEHEAQSRFERGALANDFDLHATARSRDGGFGLRCQHTRMASKRSHRIPFGLLVRRPQFPLNTRLVPNEAREIVHQQMQLARSQAPRTEGGRVDPDETWGNRSRSDAISCRYSAEVSRRPRTAATHLMMGCCQACRAARLRKGGVPRRRQPIRLGRCRSGRSAPRSATIMAAGGTLRGALMRPPGTT